MGGSSASPSISSAQLQQNPNLCHVMGGFGSKGGNSVGGGGGVIVTVTKNCPSISSKSSNPSPSILQHAQVYPTNDAGTSGVERGINPHKNSSHLGKAVNHHVRLLFSLHFNFHKLRWVLWLEAYSRFSYNHKVLIGKISSAP